MAALLDKIWNRASARSIPLSGGHSIVDPPDSIPNSEVKRNRADGSVALAHARVGHRQDLSRSPADYLCGALLCGHPARQVTWCLASVRRPHLAPLYHGTFRGEGKPMHYSFKVGDHVCWNSEAGWVSGRILAVHVRDTPYKGHMRRCTPDAPQYEIHSDKTDHIAMHKGTALTRITD